MLRRVLLITGAVTALLALRLIPHWTTAEPLPLSKSFTHANFSAYLGQSFYVYGGEMGLRKVVSLALIAVSERKRDANTEQFFVRFRGPGDPVLSKSVYTLEHHSTADKFQLFLEPEGQDAKGQYYRAVFSLLR